MRALTDSTSSRSFLLIGRTSQEECILWKLYRHLRTGTDLKIQYETGTTPRYKYEYTTNRTAKHFCLPCVSVEHDLF